MYFYKNHEKYQKPSVHREMCGRNSSDLKVLSIVSIFFDRKEENSKESDDFTHTKKVKLLMTDLNAKFLKHFKTYRLSIDETFGKV